MGARLLIVLLVLATLAGCAHVPQRRYGIRHLELEGVETMDEHALRACLATGERARAGVTLGTSQAPTCGVPPFADRRAQIELWWWPWSDWPLFDRVVLERDMARIRRWYQARGYYGVEVTEATTDPLQARTNDTLEADTPEPGCERLDSDEGCDVNVTIHIEEGEPTLVTELSVHGHQELDRELRESLEAAPTLAVGQPFDEALFEASKRALLAVLAGQGYARAGVRAVARVDRPERTARVELHVDPGPACVFGRVLVEGADGLPVDPIRHAALITEGQPYRHANLTDAQRAIFGMGAFSAVVVEPLIPDEGNVVDVKVQVTPAREHRFGLGVGVQGGELESIDGGGLTSVPQWDVHLIARYENRNLFGGLRRLRIEERPRLIFNRRFPAPGEPRLGNRVLVELRQPGLLEPRLTGVIGASHEFGPDPYDNFFRHRFDAWLRLERGLWREHLFAQIGVRESVYRVSSSERADPPMMADGTLVDIPANSDLAFFEQSLRFDYRDNRSRPRSGVFMQLTASEAGWGLPSSWKFVRLIPELRLYAPLPFGMTFAARFGLGMYFIRQADSDLDVVSQQLGPRDYRLRGGGPSSNRGFLPGQLGDGDDGGTRRWEANFELRLPVTSHTGIALFWDMGDVSKEESFRFDHLQASFGGGLRVYTIVTLRLDFGWRVPGLQFLNDDRRDPMMAFDDTRLGFPGAVHFSIGEAF